MRRALLLALLFTLVINPVYPQSQVGGQGTIVVTTATPITISFSPQTQTLSTGQTQNFIITLTNDTGNLGANITVTGSGCTGAACGTISPSFARTGQTVVYTAPGTVPSPNVVNLTGTSVQDPTKFTNATITLSGSPPAPIVVNHISVPDFQPSTATNTLAITTTSGNALDVVIYNSIGDTVTSVQACPASGPCSNLTQVCPPSGPCVASTSPSSGPLLQVQEWYGIGLSSMLTSIKVTNSPVTSNTGIAVYDISNIIALDTASQASAQTTPTTNPIGPAITTTTSDIVISGIGVTSDVNSVASPFIFTLTTFDNGTAYLLSSTPGTFSPSWNIGSGAWAGFTAAFKGGVPQQAILVSVAPTSASIAVNTTKTFTPTVANDSLGVNWTLSGSGCSGATCGTLSATSTASGVPVTYTAPAGVPSPATVTLTATSITDPTKSAAATITVTAAPVVGVTVAPTSASIIANGTQSITATVTNSASGVNWTVTGSGCTGAACGTLSSTSTASGVANIYTAPGTVPSPATVTVKATSVSDGTKSASATFTITAPVISVSVSPTSVTLNSGGATQQFTPTVLNSGSGVGWALSGSSCSGATCGTLSATTSASGVPVTYTSPTTGSSLTVILTATSIADSSKTATAQININQTSSSFKCTLPNCPAFPEAQGGGASSAGGRGGVTFNVTTTADATNSACVPYNVDNVVCSLRDALTQSVPRTVVFRVAGLFQTNNQVFNTGNDGEIEVDNPFLTIACQNAPGQIIFGGENSGSVLRLSTHDSITRYCTFAPDNTIEISGPNTGTVGWSVINTAGYNHIVDHITSRWTGNKTWIMYAGFVTTPPEYNALTTMQFSLFYEPHEGHPVGPSTSENDTASITALSHDIDWHHNMFVNIDHRIPEYNHSPMRQINNYTYNYSSYASLALGATQTDLIGNVWNYNNLVPGFGSPIYSTDGTYPGSNPGTPSFYIVGNIGNCSPNCTTVNSNQAALFHKAAGENVGSDEGLAPSGWIRTTPLASATPYPITVDPAPGLLAELAPLVGNSQHLDCNGNWVSHRDAADSRIVKQVQTQGTGGFWPNGVTFVGESCTIDGTGCTSSDGTFVPAPTANWKNAPITGFPVCACTLHDGIPDAWRTLYGVTKASTAIDPARGITYLEVYNDHLVP